MCDAKAPLKGATRRGGLCPSILALLLLCCAASGESATVQCLVSYSGSLLSGFKTSSLFKTSELTLEVAIGDWGNTSVLDPTELEAVTEDALLLWSRDTKQSVPTFSECLSSMLGDNNTFVEWPSAVPSAEKYALSFHPCEGVENRGVTHPTAITLSAFESVVSDPEAGHLVYGTGRSQPPGVPYAPTDYAVQCKPSFAAVIIPEAYWPSSSVDVRVLQNATVVNPHEAVRMILYGGSVPSVVGVRVVPGGTFCNALESIHGWSGNVMVGGSFSNIEAVFSRPGYYSLCLSVSLPEYAVFGETITVRGPTSLVLRGCESAKLIVSGNGITQYDYYALVSQKDIIAADDMQPMVRGADFHQHLCENATRIYFREEYPSTLSAPWYRNNTGRFYLCYRTAWSSNWADAIQYDLTVDTMEQDLNLYDAQGDVVLYSNETIRLTGNCYILDTTQYRKILMENETTLATSGVQSHYGSTEIIVTAGCTLISGLSESPPSGASPEPLLIDKIVLQTDNATSPFYYYHYDYAKPITLSGVLIDSTSVIITGVDVILVNGAAFGAAPGLDNDTAQTIAFYGASTIVHSACPRGTACPPAITGYSLLFTAATGPTMGENYFQKRTSDGSVSCDTTPTVYIHGKVQDPVALTLKSNAAVWIEQICSPTTGCPISIDRSVLSVSTLIMQDADVKLSDSHFLVGGIPGFVYHSVPFPVPNGGRVDLSNLTVTGDTRDDSSGGGASSGTGSGYFAEWEGMPDPRSSVTFCPITPTYLKTASFESAAVVLNASEVFGTNITYAETSLLYLKGQGHYVMGDASQDILAPTMWESSFTVHHRTPSDPAAAAAPPGAQLLFANKLNFIKSAEPPYENHSSDGDHGTPELILHDEATFDAGLLDAGTCDGVSVNDLSIPYRIRLSGSPLYDVGGQLALQPSSAKLVSVNLRGCVEFSQGIRVQQASLRWSVLPLNTSPAGVRFVGASAVDIMEPSTFDIQVPSATVSDSASFRVTGISTSSEAPPSVACRALTVLGTLTCESSSISVSNGSNLAVSATGTVLLLDAWASISGTLTVEDGGAVRLQRSRGWGAVSIEGNLISRGILQVPVAGTSHNCKASINVAGDLKLADTARFERGCLGGSPDDSGMFPPSIRWGGRLTGGALTSSRLRDQDCVWFDTKSLGEVGTPTDATPTRGDAISGLRFELEVVGKTVYLIPRGPDGDLRNFAAGVVCVLVAVALAISMQFRSWGGFTTFARHALQGPVVSLDLPLFDNPAWRDIVPLILILCESLWLCLLSLHPDASWMPLPESSRIHIGEALILHGATSSTPLFIGCATTIGVWAVLWLRLRRSTVSIKQACLSESTRSNPLGRIWNPTVATEVCKVLGRWRYLHVGLSVAGSALLAPVLLVLLRPLRCAAFPGEAPDMSSGICDGSPASVAKCSVACVAVPLLAYLVVDTGSHTTAPLRHPPFIGRVGVRTTRIFDALRVISLCIIVTTLTVATPYTGEALLGTAISQGIYFAVSLAIHPSVYQNINRIRSVSQLVGVWSVSLSYMRFLSEDRLPWRTCTENTAPFWWVFVWCAGCAVLLSIFTAVRRGEVTEDSPTTQHLLRQVRDAQKALEESALAGSSNPAEPAAVADHRVMEELYAMPYYVGATYGMGMFESDLAVMLSDNNPTSPAHYIGWTRGQLLGKGSFGSVYIGILTNGALVAVKVIDLPVQFSSCASNVEAVQREVDFIQKLRHPNIVEYKACFFDRDARSINIFMEYAVGGSLTSLVKMCKARLSEAVGARYVRQILQGLAFLHRNDVIHRDIKGENVLLDAEGRVKLADFGCARDVSHTTLCGSFAGSPYWMAPEVIRNRGYNTKADIWSVGCTTIEVLTRGETPWAPFDSAYAAMYHVANSSEHPTNKPADASPECAAFFDVCFMRDPGHRPSAVELLEHMWLAQSESPNSPSAGLSPLGAAANFVDALSSLPLSEDKGVGKKILQGDRHTLLSAPDTATLLASAPPTLLESPGLGQPLLPPQQPDGTLSRDRGEEEEMITLL